ncbi:helix-hairpin-helix domain-containing protein [Chamaesiphon sp. VAR_69_metabat_338]|uniref:helix-hairpin-helix domain-containing protein n=1 Tax=Chamaesiphon sp. VAR_69_metabat_338 TaxID=2964704 RepID=UPI00286E0F50|nr:helix-hairpin-helix domain-containing protein [Chamaesiphon sp. VAR_69_metabat_338]
MKFLTYLGYGLASAVLLISVNACMNTTPTAVAPTPTVSSSSAPGGHQIESRGKKININNALISELDKLEAKLGVPALSNKIQGSRPYAKPEELVSKKVIDQAQYDQIKDLVTIEDVSLTGEARDVDYMTKLGLMKGHLMVAKELLDLKQAVQAEPHIGHPVEEIYADVEEQLKERKVPEFKTPLIALHDLVKGGAKDGAKVNADFTVAMKSVDGAISILPATQRNSATFTLQVINGLLDTANSEYKSSIAKGKIAQIVEYQDSRGFVTYVNQLFRAIEPQLKQANPAVATTIGTTLADLTKAWPAPIAPAAPVKTAEEVTKLVKQIESEAMKIAKTTT